MKKLFTILLCALCCAGFVVAGDYFPVKLTVAAAGTSATADIDLTQPAYGYKALEVGRVTASCISGNGTGTVTFASVDHAVATTIATSTAIKSGQLYTGYPTYTVATTAIAPMVSYTNASPVVTLYTNTTVSSNIVYTNGIPFVLLSTNTAVTQVVLPGAQLPVTFPSTNAVSTVQPYLLKTVRVSVTQAAVSGATVYNAMIFVK